MKFRGSPAVPSGTSDSNEADTVRQLLVNNKRTRGQVGAVRSVVGRVRQKDGSGQGKQKPEESQLRRTMRQQQDQAAPDLSRVYRVGLSGGDPNDMAATLQACREMPEVEYAELNVIISACVTPTDLLLASQWAINKIQASAAWDTCVGTTQPVVAIIDSGVDSTHRDLQSNLWINEAELQGVAGVDDDENGYVDDVNGYNFVYRTNDPADDYGHGTHVAGIVAAVGNNGQDIAGVCWLARIMPLKILDSEGYGDTATAAAAIYYAVANGADVINASWGGPDESQVLADAIAYAERQGAIVVAAAGNEGTATPFYPAYYATVLAVAASDRNDRLLTSSNYGDWVDLAAPGGSILSLRASGTSLGTPQTDFTMWLSGTSMAAPHVAGACALLLAANPFLKCEQVRQIVTTSGDSISTGLVSSQGRLNVAAAMKQAVAKKGVVYFDRSAYPRGGDIGILLVDSDLAGKTTQSVTVQTSGSDVEAVTLTQTTWAKGVFAGTLASRDATAVAASGRLEISDGQTVTVRYTDADDGQGHTSAKVTAEAVADYQAAAVVSVDTGIRSSAVRLVVTTNEPTQAEVRYHLAGSTTSTWVTRSDALSASHEILISPLPRKTDYQFTIHLTDAAGNESSADNNGTEYAFTTASEATDLRVPGVYPTIQAAIDAAWTGDTIRVADGTYTGAGNTDIDFGGKALTLCSENGPSACIIDCNEQAGGFYFYNGEDAHSIVDGFTITHSGNVDLGGGICCVASSPTIRNCIFRANEAGYYGGAICNQYGSSPTISACTFQENAVTERDGCGGAVANRFGSHPILSDCTFTGNTSGEDGGAVANADDSRPQIMGCVFQSNTARFRGGAIANDDESRPVLSRCVFAGNSASSYGGAIFCAAGTETCLDHCLFSGNTASYFGGAIGNDGATVTLVNCTLAGNTCQRYGGGLWNDAGSIVSIDDSILWGNTDSYSPAQLERAQVVRDNVDLTVNYSCIQGATADLSGTGNISSDPLFADATTGDYHLKSRAGRWDPNQETWVTDTVTSPCIDAGNPDRSLGDEPTSTSLDPGNAWSINRRIDMGVYGGTSEAGMAPLN